MDHNKPIPKKRWGPGPWQDEPDELQWVDNATGLNCRIKRNMHVTGSLCGYVGVPPTHPAYGLSYNGITQTEHDEQMKRFRAGMKAQRGKPNMVQGMIDAGDFDKRHEPIPGIGDAILDIRVHGGLTYAGPWFKEEKGNLWWFGFDCSHALDLSPLMDATLKRIHIDGGTTNAPYRQRLKGYEDVYRDLNYVKAQVVSLADQLKAMERPFVMPAKENSDRSG